MAVTYALDVLTDLLEVVTFELVTVIDVDVLADEDINNRAEMTNLLEFTLSVPWGEAMPLCCR